MELGPIQKLWVDTLRAHPERQTTGSLGSISIDGHIEACCLGQAYLCLREYEGSPYIPEDEEIYDDDDNEYLTNSYHELGLRDALGGFKTTFGFSGRYANLAEANDKGTPWDEIADFIEKNPEEVFTHSV